MLNYYVRCSEGWIGDRLEEAKTAGELAPDVDARELAACLFGIVYGVRVKARANEAPERIRIYKDRVLSALLSPHRPRTSAAG